MPCGDANVEALTSARVGALLPPVFKSPQKVALIKIVPILQAVGERERHCRVVGPFARFQSERSASNHVGERLVGIAGAKLQSRPNRVADSQPEQSPDRTIPNPSRLHD